MEQKEMVRPLYTFNALIVACGRSGASNDAIELFEEMQKLGVRPDRITYVGVISATTASGQWDLAQSFIRKMQVCTLVCFS
jgi:pentatricopeptide repeat protein